VKLAAYAAQHNKGFVLVLLDCEDNCPGTLGPDLLAKAQGVHGQVEIIVALAYRECETWFLQAAESLRGTHGISAGTTAPPNPTSIRDAKGWLSARMAYPYDETTHQLDFVRKFDIAQARANASFDRFCQRIAALLARP